MIARRHTVLLIDDEALARRRLRQLLNEAPDFDVVGECADAREVSRVVRDLRPDVVFLDIRMPHLDGFEVREAIESLVRQVVFVTAFAEHAARAFDVAATDYLVKPVTQARFTAALDRVRRSLGEPGAERILLGGRLGGTAVKVSDVTWVEADGAYVVVHAAGRRHVLRESMGTVDVLVGMAVLFAPRGLPLLYMTAWATWTALLRPLAGESVFETLERAGNYGVPLALMVLTARPRWWNDLVRLLDRPTRDERVLPVVRQILKWTTCVLLLGHGALGVASKPMLTAHYAAIGLPGDTTVWLGWLELSLAIAVAVRPVSGLLLFIAAWKIATESLFVVEGAPIWESVERAGSYAAPLALAVLNGQRLPVRLGSPVAAKENDDDDAARDYARPERASTDRQSGRYRAAGGTKRSPLTIRKRSGNY